MARERLLPLIQQEGAVLRGLKHRHIVQVVGTYETTSVPRQFGIILFPAGDEDLSHYLERVGENEFPEEDLVRLRNWPLCLASAVDYIHAQNIRHKDIKPSNIICKDDEVLLTDFGSAHQFSAGLTSSTEGITKMYSAPEVIAFDRRGRSADIYSLGCVFAEMYTVSDGRRIEDFHDFRSEPVPDEPGRMTLVYHATSHKIETWFATQDDPWPFSLISQMMADDPKTRPTAEDLLQTLGLHQSGRATAVR
jgi:serine/threonine protein kinase